ncbi:Ig-like domain-containing protein, partial [Helcococcus ovis]|uniref:Ig-like domain-containing protein n=1 Tax=Helcococcus ovis TaxID=72026 RepID=UPI0038BC5022
DKDNHKPNLNTPKEGDKVISGTGKPGDEIVVTDGEGKTLGKTKVKPDGKFELELGKPLKEGDKVKVTPITDGKSGTPAE